MLFDSYTNSAITLANRIAMAPMTRCRADHRDAVPNDLIVAYYRQRAGAGLIISEGVPVSDRARGYINTPALWNEAQAAGWQRVTQTVHAAGGRIFAQLWHCGRVSHAALHADGSPPAGVSATVAATQTMIPGPDGGVVPAPCGQPKALSVEEIKGVVVEFGHAARLAMQAGFDGVEIHGANGYLLDQFLQDSTNTRTDAYGGSIENRARLMLEVADACVGVWGAGRVGMHLAPRGDAHDMGDSDRLATFTHVARELGRRGIAFIAARENSGPGRIGPQLKAAFGGTWVANEGLDLASANALIAAGEADAAAFGKLFIANPDLPRRFATGATLNTPDPQTFYAAGPKGYTDYPPLA